MNSQFPSAAFSANASCRPRLCGVASPDWDGAFPPGDRSRQQRILSVREDPSSGSTSPAHGRAPFSFVPLEARNSEVWWRASRPHDSRCNMHGSPPFRLGRISRIASDIPRKASHVSPASRRRISNRFSFVEILFTVVVSKQTTTVNFNQAHAPLIH